MERELFGVFGPRTAFDELAPARFDRVVEGASVTVGVRDDALALPNRTDTYRGPEGLCVVWGELYVPAPPGETARWLLEQYAVEGRDALDGLNGSYLAVIEHDGDAVVVTDLLRSRECFYTDAPGVRVFGTDPASVSATAPRRRVDALGLMQFLHFGVVLGERTSIERVRRVPIDAVLTREAVEPLSRFVYEPGEFDYARELATRIRRAVRRRSPTSAGRTGLLLSAGYDSRAVLATHPGVDVCYTLGTPGSDEVAVARRLADQYGAAHVRLDPGDRYLVPTDRAVEYSLGIKETVHIHHDRCDPDIDADTVLHGWLFDTLFRDYFVPQRTIEVAGVTIPLGRLDPDPDPASFFGEILEADTAVEDLVAECDGVAADTREAFIRECLERELERCYERCDGIHNAFTQLAIRNQPSVPFRYHLADQFVESFVAMDRDLLEWHLRTPPEHRNDRTFLRALRYLDDGILDHRPPNRPYDAALANEATRFLRRKLPLLTPFDSPWPSRAEFYDRADLDRQFFPDEPELHDAPIRFKLRLNDIRSWLRHAGIDASGRDAPPLAARPRV